MKLEFEFNPDSLNDAKEASCGPEEPEAREPGCAVDPKARLLALAYHLQDMVETGLVKDTAHLARVAGVSRARMSQVLDLVLLEPKVQEALLKSDCGLGAHKLRKGARNRVWATFDIIR